MRRSATHAGTSPTRRRSSRSFGVALILLVLALALPAAAYASPSRGGATWKARRPVTSVALTGVTFVDATHGRVVGDNGTILGTIDGGATWSPQDPGIRTPAITRFKPASGKRGASVTITGTAFAAKRGNSSVTFGKQWCTKYVSWSATKIVCKVPAKAAYGAVKLMVTTANGESNAKSFKVKR